MSGAEAGGGDTCPACPVLLEGVPAAHQTHGEVANAERVLQKALEGHGPAGHSPLAQTPAALHAGQAGIAAQAVVAHAVLQVSASQLCGPHTPRSLRPLPSRPPPPQAVPSGRGGAPTLPPRCSGARGRDGMHLLRQRCTPTRAPPGSRPTWLPVPQGGSTESAQGPEAPGAGAR